MAVLRIPDERRSIAVAEDIRAFLADFGIWYERWDTTRRLPADASSEQVLEAYAPEIARLKSRGGYVTADVIDVAPDTPGLEAMLEKFSREHTHSEDEVRFVIAGRGVFHINPVEAPVFSVEMEPGDLINVPAGTRHWFHLCREKTIKTIRLFQSQSGWSPIYEQDGIHARYEPLCLGSHYFPPESFSARTNLSSRKSMPDDLTRAILLDIEGTTSSVAFVYEVLFPFARAEMRAFLEGHWESAEVLEALAAAASDAGCSSLPEWLGDRDRAEQIETAHRQMLEWMDRDGKLTGLKALQGLIWKQGYEAGRLTSHVFPDVPAALRRWTTAGLRVFIYSSGSAVAQKLYFTHTASGDLSGFVSGYFDTTIGAKRDAASYTRIASLLDLGAGEILFCSDIPQELDAALAAGMQAALVLRPGNAPVACDHTYRQVRSLEEIPAADD